MQLIRAWSCFSFGIWSGLYYWYAEGQLQFWWRVLHEIFVECFFILINISNEHCACVGKSLRVERKSIVYQWLSLSWLRYGSPIFKLLLWSSWSILTVDLLLSLVFLRIQWKIDSTCSMKNSPWARKSVLSFWMWRCWCFCVFLCPLREAALPIFNYYI